MKHCLTCGGEYDEQDSSCPACGHASTELVSQPPTLPERSAPFCVPPTPSDRLSEPFVDATAVAAASNEESAKTAGGPLPPLLSTWEGPLPPVIELAKPIRAGGATLVLLGYLGAQFVAAIVVAFFGGAWAAARGKHFQDPNFARDLMQSIMGPIAVLSVLLGGVAVVLLSRHLGSGSLNDSTEKGAAWKVGQFRKLLHGLGLGVIVAIIYGVFATVLGMHPSEKELGPLAKMSTTSGLPQLLWIVTALLLAPPVEELLFRGVLYAGYCRSFGPVWAGFLTTLIFVLLHLGETIYFLPALLGITGLAVAALWMRLRSGAIGPAVAVHVGYNGMAVLAVLAYTLAGRH